MLCYTFDYTYGSIFEVNIMSRSRPASNPISYIQLYNGDEKTLLQSLERIQRTAAEILGAIAEEPFEMGKERVCAATVA